MPQLRSLIVLVSQNFPGLPIVAGGQAFRHGGQEVIDGFDHVTLVKDLNELEQYIQSFQNHE